MPWSVGVRMFRYCLEVIMGDLPWAGDMKGCVAIVVFAGSLTQTQCVVSL